MPVPESVPPLLVELAVLLVAGTLIAAVLARFRVVPIVGFMAAGAVIGPDGVGLVSDIDLVNQSADIGVMLLLFTLGIEFSLARVRQMASVFLVGGGIQVGLATGIVAAAAMAFGIDWRAAVFTGLLVSLSSTVIVLNLLAEKRATTSPTGNFSVALLIYQDLASVAMVLVVPSLAGDSDSWADIVLALATAGAIVAAVMLVAKTVVPWLLSQVECSQSEDVFLLAILAICFGTALLTSLAGVSIFLGAFLAGLMVSESRSAARAIADVMPLQILFTAMFFVSIGMLFDLAYFAHNARLVIGLALGTVIAKLVSTAAAAAIVRQPRRVVVASAVVLSQIGEFSFVLERVGEDVGFLPLGLADGTEAFIAVAVLLIALSSFSARIKRLWPERPAPHPSGTDSSSADTAAGSDLVENETARGHAVVNGFGPRAHAVAAAFELAGIPYALVSMDPRAQSWAARTGRRVLAGDISRQLIAERAGLREARIALAVDSQPSDVAHFARIVREHNPEIVILAWSVDPDDAADLERGGLVNHVVAERQAALDALIAHTLGHFGMPEPQIESVTRLVMHHSNNRL
ncbi:MAG: potassium transporter KefB [Acidimicrobiales bacterium]|nr:potassium transporter KefB [Acidimicrobiales bacterium]MYG87817.1 potassium transporter KefB [Acidimicrobiales bacterium]MYI27374.1 potassium transporter KefB [Acidimicrobiales bacterium]